MINCRSMEGTRGRNAPLHLTDHTRYLLHNEDKVEETQSESSSEEETKQGSSSWRCWPQPLARPMSIYESIRLSPFQKWSKFGKPPWKFIINVFLVICTTAQVVLLNVSVSTYSRTQIAAWRSRILPEHDLYTIEQVVDTVRKVRDMVSLPLCLALTCQYYSLENSSVDSFNFFVDEHGDLMPPLLHVRFYQDKSSIFDPSTPFDGTIVEGTHSSCCPFEAHFGSGNHPLLEDSLGPFDSTGEILADFVHAIVSMRISFSIRNYDNKFGTQYCYRWDINVSCLSSSGLTLVDRF